MKNDYPHDNAKKSGSISTISIGSAIVFAVIAFVAYGFWTKVRTDNCLQEVYESYNREWATACKSLAKTGIKRNGKPDCLLPRLLAKDLDNKLQKNKNFCVNYG